MSPEIPADKLVSDISLIAQNVRTQDNRITANPIFTVQQRHKKHRKWEFVTACLTEQGCKDFIAADGHNYYETRIYVVSGYRNREWEILREFFKSL